MLVALAHCSKESEQAKRLAAWLAELGPYPNHRLLVGRDARAEPNLFANSGFASVEEITITGDVWNEWARSANNAFRQIGKHIEFTSKEPWLWMESDAIPLKKEWLDLIEAEYKACGKPFLGDFVHVPEMMNVPDHCSGIAVYPGALSHFAGEAYLAHEIAWDVAASGQIVPQMHKSKHILHRWKHFAFETLEQVQKSIFDVKPEAVLFHADKAGSLIQLLREQRTQPVSIPFKEAMPDSNYSVAAAIKQNVPESDLVKEWINQATGKRVIWDGKSWVAVNSDSLKTESHSTALTIAGLNGDSREVILRDAVAVLKKLCTAPRYVSQVRKELKAQGVTR